MINFITKLSGSHYCGVCNKDTQHLRYDRLAKINCLECGNILGENDERKEAKIHYLRPEYSYDGGTSE